jgi:hypothetical protein
MEKCMIIDYSNTNKTVSYDSQTKAAMDMYVESGVIPVEYIETHCNKGGSSVNSIEEIFSKSMKGNK